MESFFNESNIDFIAFSIYFLTKEHWKKEAINHSQQMQIDQLITIHKCTSVSPKQVPQTDSYSSNTLNHQLHRQ